MASTPKVRTHAVFVDQKGGALDALVLPPVQVALAPDAVGLQNRMLWIGDEREGEFVFVGKFLVRGNLVR